MATMMRNWRKRFPDVFEAIVTEMGYAPTTVADKETR